MPDWLKEASPDQVITQTTAALAKIARMDSHVQDQFIQQLRADPQASRLFERVGTLTG